MQLITPLLFVSVALNGASAFSSGAGGCTGGQAAVSGFHLQEENAIEMGSLEVGVFEVILDDVLLNPSNQMSFTIGEDHVLTISGRFFHFNMKYCM
jgi:hypothetical protein